VHRCSLYLSTGGWYKGSCGVLHVDLSAAEVLRPLLEGFLELVALVQPCRCAALPACR
jgi:hypothetical protein